MEKILCPACADSYTSAFDVTKKSKHNHEGVCDECEKRKIVSEYIILRKRGDGK